MFCSFYSAWKLHHTNGSKYFFNSHTILPQPRYRSLYCCPHVPLVLKISSPSHCLPADIFAEYSYIPPTILLKLNSPSSSRLSPCRPTLASPHHLDRHLLQHKCSLCLARPSKSNSLCREEETRFWGSCCFVIVDGVFLLAGVLFHLVEKTIHSTFSLYVLVTRFFKDNTLVLCNPRGVASFEPFKCSLCSAVRTAPHTAHQLPVPTTHIGMMGTYTHGFCSLLLRFH